MWNWYGCGLHFDHFDFVIIILIIFMIDFRWVGIFQRGACLSFEVFIVEVEVSSSSCVILSCVIFFGHGECFCGLLCDEGGGEDAGFPFAVGSSSLEGIFHGALSSGFIEGVICLGLFDGCIVFFEDCEG